MPCLIADSCRRPTRLLLPLLLAGGLLSPSAQAGEWVASLGYGQWFNIKGLEWQLGYRFKSDQLGFNLMPLSGILHDRDSAFGSLLRVNDSSPNACQSGSSAQSRSNYCADWTDDYAVLASADWSFKSGMSLGAGARLSRHSTLFATARFSLSKELALQVNGAANYFALGLSLGF
ncbi:hypothetical protein HNP55_004565 [Paucibacter oligotrophus]|uniref:Outer membrane protein with beta-barrel domain n=1 Tax=Roseateles oligotrophus TaxID=1769250 RepID=A0A840LE94_9BURK|nr:hypothetical protein [Roseateles oligotrophus]MBB4846011.1 hypothetical protein [Roseateles oligotrophus]